VCIQSCLCLYPTKDFSHPFSRTPIDENAFLAVFFIAWRFGEIDAQRLIGALDRAIQDGLTLPIPARLTVTLM